MSKNVTIFIHDHEDGPARLSEIFAGYGFVQTDIFAPEADLAGFDPLAPDLLVVMGGPMGVYEANTHPYLHHEIRILARRLQEDRPTLGICLGAQLMAQALGSTVYKGAHGFELGWHEIDVTPEGRSSPARHLDKSATKIFQWHQDTFDLPEGATLLARSALYENQIYTFGKNAMAVQSHPELLKTQLLGWAHGVKDASLKDRIIKETPEYLPHMGAQFRLFMEDWLKSVSLL